MSPSRPFILRPVATSLLMAGLLLAGVVAYKLLPVSALPQVDYPTIQVITFYPGASPDVMASSVTAPLERQFGQVPGLKQMTSTSSDGSSVITLQFALELNIDVAEQEVQAAINAAGTYLPRDLPNPPIYSKMNPADAPILTLALTSDDAAAVEGRGPGRHAPRAEDLAAARRRPGEHQRRPEAGRAHPGQPDRARVLRPEHRRRAHRHRAGQRESGQGQLRRAAQAVRHRRQRSAPLQRRSTSRSSSPTATARRCACPDVADGRRRRRERPPGGVDERDARRHREHPAAAGRQHHRGRRPRQGACCRSSRASLPRVGQGHDPHRPHHHHPRLGGGRAVRADAHHRAGGDGDLPVPAQRSPRPSSPAWPCRSRWSARSA